MQKNLRRSECFELNTILTVVLGINPNVIDEVLQNWQKILFLCLKYVSVLQLIFYFKGASRYNLRVIAWSGFALVRRFTLKGLFRLLALVVIIIVI